jgi:RNA polymerase sigma-70 factor (ECF subfamily)
MQAVLLVNDFKEAKTPPEGADAHLELMSRIASNQDRAAFKLLFQYFAPRIKGLMLKSGSSQELAEDIAQTVMLTVWNKVSLFAPERGSVSAWIFTIARNARVDRLRRGSSQPYLDIDDIELASQEPGSEELVFTGQRAQKIAEAIRGLPPEQREIIELAFVQDIPQSEIAQKMSVPLGTVKSRLRLAYAKLRHQLEDLK